MCYVQRADAGSEGVAGGGCACLTLSPESAPSAPTPANPGSAPKTPEPLNSGWRGGPKGGVHDWPSAPDLVGDVRLMAPATRYLEP